MKISIYNFQKGRYFKAPNKRLVLVFPVIVLLIISSCSKNSCVKSSGEIVEEERLIEEFTKLTIEDLFTVYYKHDSINRVVISAGKNLIDQIITEVSDSNLLIENINRCNWMRSLKVRPEITVYAKKINTVLMNGESDFISIDTITTEVFTYEVWSGVSSTELLLDCSQLNFSLNATTGDYNISGRAGVEYIYSVGNSYVYASNLMSAFSFISSNSTGDIYVNSSQKIEVHLLNSGDIFYSGCPSVALIIEQLSTGSLIHLD